MKTESVGLVKYDAMCKAIATCYSVDEAKDIRDKARAVEVYAKQAKNKEAERLAIEIRIRAEHRAGDLLKKMKESGELRRLERGRPRKASRVTTLSTLGISRDQSAKWQKLGQVPADQFEAAVKQPGATSDGIINAHSAKTSPAPQVDAKALWLWGRLKDFERDGLLQRDPRKIFAGMTDSMRDDILRLLPDVIRWLEDIIICASTAQSS